LLTDPTQFWLNTFDEIFEKTELKSTDLEQEQIYRLNWAFHRNPKGYACLFFLKENLTSMNSLVNVSVYSN
jgi:hypothetical protein